MNTTIREESPRPLGVVGCLMAGFELIGQRLWLIALPVLLDLFLWLGPRLSVAPLLNELAAFLRVQPAPDVVTATQVMEVTQFLEEMGGRLNLFAFLGNLPFLNVPSLLAWPNLLPWHTFSSPLG